MTKKSILKLSLIVLISVSNCGRIEEMPDLADARISSAEKWYATISKNFDASNGRRFTPLWKEAQWIANERILLVPIVRKLEIVRVNSVNVRRLLVKFDDLFEVESGRIVEIYSTKYQFDYPELFASFGSGILRQGLTYIEWDLSYRNSRGISLRGDKVFAAKITTQNPISGQAERTKMNCTDWFMVYSDPNTGQVVFEVYLFTTCDLCADQSQCASLDDGNNHNGGPVNSNRLFEVRDSINNKIENECLRKMVEKAVVENLDNSISHIINSVFRNSDRIDINFYEENSLLGPNEPGECQIFWQNNGRFMADVYLNVNVLPGASEEMILSTIIHEVLHAYLGYSRDPRLFNDHEEMANEYVNLMKATLLNYLPGLAPNHAEALAWGGLHMTSAWRRLQTQNPAKANEIIELNHSHLAGSYGTCE